MIIKNFQYFIMQHPAKKKSFHEIGSLSTSLPSNSSKNQRNEKLQAIFDRQQAKTNLQIIFNRVNQLQKVKKKAEKEIEDLKSQISKEQASLNNKAQNTQEKQKFLYENQEFLESRRQSLRQDREKRKKNIQNLETEILNQKKQIVKETKENSKKWDFEMVFNKRIDLEDKIKKYKNVKNGYVKSLRDRCLSQRSQREKTKNDYFESILKEKKIEEETIEKVAQFEQIESNLIQELSTTVKVRNNLLKNLNKIKASFDEVSSLSSSVNYFHNFALKRLKSCD